MKYVVIIFLLFTNSLFAQLAPLPSQVFQVSENISKTRYGSKSAIFKGEGDVLKIQEMSLLRIQRHKKITLLVAADREHFYVIKKGADFVGAFLFLFVKIYFTASTTALKASR